MRLCDLNKALEELCKYCACGSYESCENRCAEFRNISNIATIDAAPVVRCKDCKWFADNNGGEWYGCWLFNGIFHGQSDIPTSDDFCSYGERKDGDGDAN